MNTNRQQRSSGFGLVEILVAAFILVVVGAAATRLIGTQSKASRSIARVGDMEVVKQSILANLDCPKTVESTMGTAAVCKSSYVLKRADGTAFPNPIGEWNYRASCKTDVIVIEVKNKKPDPQLGTHEWRTLFDASASLCRPSFLTNPCSGDDTVIGMAGPIAVCGKAVANGGVYHTRCDGGTCRGGNPKAGGKCACPKGYHPMQTGGFCAGSQNSGYIPREPWSGFYCDVPPGHPKNQPYKPPGGCGYLAWACVPL